MSNPGGELGLLAVLSENTIQQTDINLPTKGVHILASRESNSESELKNVDLMGERIGRAYSKIWSEVAVLHHKWHEFKALYATDESRIKLLNQIAPQLFLLLQDALWKDIVLSIARLTEQAKMRNGKENLSLEKLLDLTTEPAHKEIISDLLKNVNLACRFAKDWRNKKLAHSDYELALERRVDPLEHLTKKKVDFALKSIAEFLNGFYALYAPGHETRFDPENSPASAEALLLILRNSLENDRRA